MADDVTDKLAAGLAKISLVLRHDAWARGGATGVTPTQAQILVLLADRRPTLLTVSAIAAELALTQPTVSDAVGALVRKKLALRLRDPADARVIRVQPTKAGLTCAAASRLWPDALVRAIGTLESGEQRVFVKALVKMIHSLQESGQIPVARMCTSCTYFRPNVHTGTDRPHHCAYVDAPLGDVDMRIDCGDHDVVAPAQRATLWGLFLNGRPLDDSRRRPTHSGKEMR